MYTKSDHYYEPYKQTRNSVNKLVKDTTKIQSIIPGKMRKNSKTMNISCIKLDNVSSTNNCEIADALNTYFTKIGPTL